MRRLEILLSFNHEVSLGGTEDYEKHLFAPTRKLIWAAADIGVRITLFTDVLAALRFREWEPERFFQPYVEQVTAAIRAGHDAQLHVHPHWLDSTHDGKRFVHSGSMQLADFAGNAPGDRRSIEGLVTSAAQFLTAVGRTAKPKYGVIAYRAAGLSLGAAEPRVLRALWDAGIRIDSSVAKGLSRRTPFGRADYRSTPRAANWHIAPDGPLDAPAERGILEVPIGTQPRSRWKGLFEWARKRTDQKQAPESTGRPHRGARRCGLDGLFGSAVSLLGFDSHTDTVEDQMALLRHHIAAHHDDDEIYVAAISHPNAMTTDCRKRMRDFVKRVRSEYGDVAHFTTFRRLHRRLERAAAPTAAPLAERTDPITETSPITE